MIGFRWLTLLAALLSAPAFSQMTSADFNAAMVKAQNGGVIDLGDQTVGFARKTFQPTAPVTIKGGHFQSVTLDLWSNVTFDGTTFENTTNTSGGYAVTVLVNGGENLTFRNVSIKGTVGPTGNLSVVPIRFIGGKNMTVEASKFSDMQGSLLLLRTDGVKFVGNDMSNIREGVDIVGATNVVVSQNRFGPFHPSPGDHPDAIQFFTANLTLPTDTAARGVTISDNLVVSSPEGRAQCYFGGDEANLTASGRGYQNIVFRNNICLGGGWHGIRLPGDIPGLVIEGNHTYKMTGADTVKDVWIAADSGVVRNNVSSRYILGPKVEASGNVTDSTETTPAAYAKVIADWEAKFRSPPAPPKPMYTPTQLKVMQIEEEVRDLRELVGLPR